MVHLSSYECFNGKVIVLTGASRGIGKAVTDALLASSWCDWGPLGKGWPRAKTKMAAFIRTDVTEYKDNQGLFKLAESEFGGIDHAVLNAGIALNSNSYFSETNDDLEEKIIDIIHVALVAGFIALPALASYNVSKHGVIGYTRSFALMPCICNVHVNAICLFYVDTDLVNTKYKNETEADTAQRKLIHTFELTTMSVVVEGALQLIADDAKSSESIYNKINPISSKRLNFGRSCLVFSRRKYTNGATHFARYNV